MKKIVSLAVIAAFILNLFSCGRSRNESDKAGSSTKNSELKASITISGAFALYPLTNAWAEEFRKEYPEVRFNISGGGAGKGMTDVLNGSADLGMFSREIMQGEKDRGVWWISVARDAVAPTLSARNPLLDRIKAEGLTKSELASYFLNDGQKFWKGTTVHVRTFTRSDAAGAAAVWAQYLGADGQESLKGIGVYGDPGLADAVKKDPGALGFNNIIYIYDMRSGEKYPGLEVAPIDLNDNGAIDPEEDFYDNLNDITSAIANGKYPAPPARELYFISKGIPDKPAVKVFLNWVLTEGQKLVEENGYIQLSSETIYKQQDKLR